MEPHGVDDVGAGAVGHGCDLDPLIIRHSGLGQRGERDLDIEGSARGKAWRGPAVGTDKSAEDADIAGKHLHGPVGDIIRGGPKHIGFRHWRVVLEAEDVGRRADATDGQAHILVVIWRRLLEFANPREHRVARIRRLDHEIALASNQHRRTRRRRAGHHAIRRGAGACGCEADSAVVGGRVKIRKGRRGSRRECGHHRGSAKSRRGNPAGAGLGNGAGQAHGGHRLIP